MATPEMINPNLFRNGIKREYEGRQLTHRCPQCSIRYPNSGMLVQHMNEEHLSFVQQTQSRIARAADKIPELSDGEKYKNTMAMCPYCKQDCQTRKKLMMHLETAHKDDEERADEEPRLKIVPLSSFVTPGAPESSVIQNFLKTIGGAPNRNLQNGGAKLDSKSNQKLQYKCFWCEASFRKRGKLMDHIDTLHKHNKQQNQVEADMTREVAESNKPMGNRQVPIRNNISHTDLHKFLPSLGANGITRGSPHPVENKPSASNGGTCSFTLAGSLTKKMKLQTQENTPPNTCKFYLGKKDNPLAGKKVTVLDHTMSQASSRGFSVPNMLEDCSTPSSYRFPYNMLPSNPVTAAMQHNYMIPMPPSLINGTPFYAPRMPMMMPSSDYMVTHAHPALEQQTTSQQVQFLARMSAMAQMSPLSSTTTRSKTTSESPLDLTKSYI